MNARDANWIPVRVRREVADQLREIGRGMHQFAMENPGRGAPEMDAEEPSLGRTIENLCRQYLLHRENRRHSRRRRWARKRTAQLARRADATGAT
jgi:hypothetical protein